ncbi:sodium/proline symporter [Venturia nashicola]|uniref:Sodium/proline symporter n=1 Tax=Venturia nashicola TaxID=86259 RepID=A0A4Z1NH87_9PEZI|nr:sodium/proline symporter [Venturia nashicola]
MSTSLLLSQSVGYGILVGVGALFALGMYFTTIILAKFANEVQGTEMFMTAKHSVKSGLLASSVVSSWTIAATLLTSTTWTFGYGISGAYFYGAGACVQIFLFAVAAIELKRKAPGAHTMLELTKLRYGVAGHWVQIIFSTLYQFFNCVCILVGTSAVFSGLTGMNQIAACFLIPLGTILYTLTGGIKATILTDWVHTFIIYVVILIGLFVTYTTSNLIGSIDEMYKLLREAAIRTPVTGNPGGQYLTMHSLDAVLYGIILFGAGCAASVDVQLFQKAIAATPEGTFTGYFLGTLCWFSIPFCLATTFGLVGRALEASPSFPTYPALLSAKQYAAGLALPYAAQALMGKGGAVAILLQIFMAATSAFSSDLVCFASVWTFDVYRAYFNPNASGGLLIKLSHLSVVLFALVCCGVAAGLTTTPVGVNFIITSIGIICNPALFPIYATVLWKQQNTYAVVGAPILGLITSLASWLGSAQSLYGSITIDTMSMPLCQVVGQVTAMISPCIYSPMITYLTGPQNFDWEIFQNIRAVDDSDVKGITREQLAAQQHIEHATAEEDTKLKHERNVAAWASIAVALCFLIIFPMPLYGTRYVFNLSFFRFWVVWTFMWAVCAAATIAILPIYQGRRTLTMFARRFILRQEMNVIVGTAARDSDSDKKADGGSLGTEKEGGKTEAILT